jgi:hypothetical protein
VASAGSWNVQNVEPGRARPLHRSPSGFTNWHGFATPCTLPPSS